ncbi:hypothetical protein [Thermogemmatispora carboxidivorans]|uniref:hypothetical protein n=1 Tax=Thermogemmatispora carboxidivorans TaxID=1382306 RepID=UPI0012DD1353|nr:hypothetical protein [Thermogemmatispora carboxidivorans]
MLQLLGLSQRSGTLIVLRQGEAWQASLQLQKGRPLSCVIINLANGRLLMSGAQAIDWLASRGELQWHLAAEGSVEAPAPAPSPGQGLTSPPFSAQEPRLSHLVPCRLSQSPPFSSWSREERLIFALIDGSRTVTEIAHLLRRSPDQIMPLLLSMTQKGAIALKDLRE